QTDPFAPSLRLADGDDQCSGRVELYHNGSWGTVCDDAWELADAKVVCRSLGCGEALQALSEARFGQGSGNILLDNVACTGVESSLEQCSQRGLGTHDCYHKEDAGIIWTLGHGHAGREEADETQKGWPRAPWSQMGPAPMGSTHPEGIPSFQQGDSSTWVQGKSCSGGAASLRTPIHTRSTNSEAETPAVFSKASENITSVTVLERALTLQLLVSPYN
uniref:SRCR domain-containing protein n=1 Tax=Athene cunicularia TaxID=194338 RepID=A0A663MUX4_ATHCN